MELYLDSRMIGALVARLCRPHIIRILSLSCMTSFSLIDMISLMSSLSHPYSSLINNLLTFHIGNARHMRAIGGILVAELGCVLKLLVAEVEG
jgi:hypothetical protein